MPAPAAVLRTRLSFLALSRRGMPHTGGGSKRFPIFHVVGCDPVLVNVARVHRILRAPLEDANVSKDTGPLASLEILLDLT